MKLSSGYRMTQTLVGFVIAAFLSVAPSSSGVEYVWTQKTDMPTARWNLATCATDGKIYAIGGFPSEGTGSKLSSMEEYDPISDTWTKKSDMPTPRGYLSASAVGGKIYAIGGGGDGASRLEEYDPVTDTWTRKADMPTERRFPASCIMNGRIYVIGGTPRDVWSGLTTVEEYDPATDTWTRKADMPLGVHMPCANVVNGKIYAIGGRPAYRSVRNVQEYDPSADTWTPKADMPMATSQMASVVLGDKIIVVGGWLWSNEFPYTAVQMYDAKTDTWTIEGDTPFLRAAVSASVVNNRMYVIGGTDRPHPCPAVSTVYELTIKGTSPDLNGDGSVDVEDVVVLTQYWGSSDSICDIGPTALGDGIVDAQDLLVLAEYMVNNPSDGIDRTLAAHWTLDETEGTVAHDSVSGTDDIVIGNPQWQPMGGKVDGALELDGIDDCLISTFGLNPADGPFSIFAWIKGGAPGQVPISEPMGTNWIMLDSEGKLMTELKGSGTDSAPLLSEAVITDEQWHRVGLVWDGSSRMLCADGVVVAEDKQSSLEASGGGLYIGVGSTFTAGTFFSGLIDDVRIYNRAVSP